MIDHITINASSSKPKYQQLVESIINSIEQGVLSRGQQLPSINELADEYNMAKATVVKSYEALRERGVIISMQGKGFYVSSTEVRNSLNIFVLFDTLNAYKEVLYQTLKDALPPDARISIFFHHYNRQIFQSLIQNNLGNFNHYVVMPHFDEDVSDIIRQIPREKLLIIDKDVKSLKAGYAAVFQDFEKDAYMALKDGGNLIKKYRRLTLVLGRNNFQYIPAGIIKGFKQFSRNSAVKCFIAEELHVEDLRKGEAYLIFSDTDLIRFLKYVSLKGWKPGRDVGLISYDDTPLKEILADGVTVITTDFESMGRTAAEMIINKADYKKINPSRLIKRKTL